MEESTGTFGVIPNIRDAGEVGLDVSHTMSPEKRTFLIPKRPSRKTSSQS